MSRWLISALLVPAAAHAEPAISDQAVGAQLGVATGGRVTPGGLQLAGRFLYQLAENDWFDGVAAFTYGGGDAQCFRDRSDQFICDHGLADGAGVEIQATVRHYFAARGKFMPFARGGIGIGIARFSADSVTGLITPLHVGGGVRAAVSDGIAVVGQGELVIGPGWFNHTLGIEPQVGIALTGGVEFDL